MRLEIRFRGKNYSFSSRALILLPLGLMISVPLLVLFVENIEIIWLQELFAKHVVFFLNLFFNLNAYAWYRPIYPSPWFIATPLDALTYISNGCTGFLAMSLFISIIIFTPHSQTSQTKKNIILRKAKAIIIAISCIYLYNVFRATIQNYLYYSGFSWSVIHDSVGMKVITITAHIVIFLFCSLYIPEWFLSLYYTIECIIIKLTQKRILEIIYEIKHKGERKDYQKVRQAFKDEGIDLYIIKKNDIDFRLMHFLNKTKKKFTSKAIKNRVFKKEEKISEDLIEAILNILVDLRWVFSEKVEKKIFYYI
ncbi:MAG: exosortase/archaeosortase family protein [Promethearchaeota archaeon]|nr:MAG: exosortase/archaeosortase family protein [Candidatus Lokiarchaeota archaeon]